MHLANLMFWWSPLPPRWRCKSSQPPLLGTKASASDTQKRLHSQRTTVWAAFWQGEVFGPFFFDDCIYSERDFALLQNELWSKILETEMDYRFESDLTKLFPFGGWDADLPIYLGHRISPTWPQVTISCGESLSQRSTKPIERKFKTWRAESK